jgi:hypothetical protein
VTAPAGTAAVAARYAEVALGNLATEFPHATQHVTRGPAEKCRPRDLHPAFHTAYDWHSCVHMHWLLVRLLSTHHAELDAARVVSTLDCTLTPAALRAEAAYLRDNPPFERPYGWAWALALAAACATSPHPAAPRWTDALAPLAATVADLVRGWLDGMAAPVRHGVHGNTAFALSVIIDAGTAVEATDLVGACRRAAAEWFAADRDCPAGWEPSGQDFLSPALTEADLMRRVLPAADFPAWLSRFLPALPAEPTTLLVPAEVRDPTDGHQGHLYGLNLSRAWQLRAIAAALPVVDVRVGALTATADRHLAAALPHVSGGDFVHDHWLATFAYLALGGAIA